MGWDVPVFGSKECTGSTRDAWWGASGGVDRGYGSGTGGRGGDGRGGNSGFFGDGRDEVGWIVVAVTGFTGEWGQACEVLVLLWRRCSGRLPAGVACQCVHVGRGVLCHAELHGV